MIKSLIALLLLVLTPMLALLFLQGPYNPLTVASNRLSESYYQSLFDSTFDVIEVELEEAGEALREQRFNEIAQKFEVSLELKKTDEAGFTAAEQVRLKKGGTVLLYRDGDTLARLLPNSDLAVIMSADETEIQETYRQAAGPFYLMELSLRKHPEPEWPNQVKQMQEQNGFPVSLIDKDDFVPPADLTEFFTINHISWYEDTNNDEVFFVRLENTDKGLVFGPIPNPSGPIAALYTSFMVIVVSAISLGLLFWLWPLWRNLKALQKSASALGDGHLSSRVAVKKMSIVSDLGKSFNHMADSIQKLITANQQLTNAVAHDLRTPLARLRFALEILESGDCSPEETQRYKQSIESSIDSLDYLVNQTLTHSRYNRMPDIRNFAECNFAEILREEVDQAAFDHPELEFQVTVDRALESSVQFVDKNALRRALSNLLSNAIKHASLMVVVSYFEDNCLNDMPKNECLHLRVEDDGEGIDEQDYQRILQPFAQLDNDERNHSLGHGLGLAIVDQIAKWHKGDIRIDRSAHGGALIELAWPKTESSN